VIEAEDGVNVEVVSKLIKTNSAACTSRSLTDGVTPLMLAVARKCPQSVLKEIIKGNVEALKIPDKEGRIPLHVAAALKADASTFTLLLKAFPAGVSIMDNAGDTPWHLAKKVKLKKEILAMLQPL
jgi:Ankyrin repeats (3 copies)